MAMCGVDETNKQPIATALCEVNDAAAAEDNATCTDKCVIDAK
jgi:hypothetical protein